MKIDSPIHLGMLRQAYDRGDVDNRRLYGLQWGDPNEDERPYLKFCRDQYITPYLNPGHTALEIGPGGGRWTRYLLSFERLFVVDLHTELLAELRKCFHVPHLIPIKNAGDDFPDVPPQSVDYVFSFGVFVHFDRPIIEAYLKSLMSIIKDTTNVVIQYSDKNKEAAKQTPSFSENTPDQMRHLVAAAGYMVLEENLTMLPHSSIMRFRKRHASETSY